MSNPILLVRDTAEVGLSQAERIEQLTKRVEQLELLLLRPELKRMVRGKALNWILKAVCAGSGVPVQAVLGPRRQEHLVLPRHLAMYLMRELTGVTWEELGEFFKRDHSAVVYGHQRTKDRMETDPEMAEEVAEWVQYFEKRGINQLKKGAA